jgi:S-formylglutathione hydrolase FrmB
MRRAAAAGLLAVLATLTAGADAPPAAPHVETVDLRSALLERPIPYRVALPGNASAGTPVVYLLHGLDGDSSNWFERTGVEEQAAALGLAVVTPEGGAGWYTDAPGAPWERSLLEEVLPDVERRFPVARERAGRAIAGLSMGGYGALKVAVRHPGHFALAASISGVVAAPSHNARADGSRWALLRESLDHAFPDPAAARAGDLFALLREPAAGARPFLYFDCGLDDPFLAQNRELAARLVEAKVPHEFRQLPGRHDWEYWRVQVGEVLRLAAGRLRGGAASPTIGR